MFRQRTPDIINYKDYLEFLPQKIQSLLRDRPPEARHYFEPSELIAHALSHSLSKSAMHPDGYRVEWYEDRRLVMLVMLLTESDETIITILKYLKDPKESVILITAKDVASISSQIDDICSKVRENLIAHLRRRNLIE